MKSIEKEIKLSVIDFVKNNWYEINLEKIGFSNHVELENFISCGDVTDAIWIIVEVMCWGMNDPAFVNPYLTEHFTEENYRIYHFYDSEDNERFFIVEFDENSEYIIKELKHSKKIVEIDVWEKI